ncbi:hypothetical protein NOCA240047 [metagenome]|uniref:Uncharacterized protein n=1 Tax=metagenome TaxID=256318 RepID=A0A2P2C5M5_9ZZZZ
MALTDQSPLYLAIRDAGLNRWLRTVARELPALFNYVSTADKVCSPIDAVGAVAAHAKSLTHQVGPYRLGGADSDETSISAQVRAVRVDFAPANVIELPPGLSSSPFEQKIALQVDGSFGLACPQVSAPLLCSNLTQFAVLTLRFTQDATLGWRLVLKLEGTEGMLELPVTLVESVNCLLGSTLALPAQASSEPDEPLMGVIDFTAAPTPVGASLGHNPSVDDHQLKARLDLTMSGHDDGEFVLVKGFEAGALPARTATGPFDLTVAASEDFLRRFFTAFVSGFRMNFSSPASAPATGGVSIGYDVTVEGLQVGSFDLRADNTVRVSEIDVRWETVVVTLEANLPQLCLPGNTVCIFGRNPDLSITLDLSEHLRSELSLTASPLVTFARHPQRGTKDLWQAFHTEAGTQIQPPTDGRWGLLDRWQIYLDAQSVDIDVFDLPDMVGDLFEQAVKDAVDAALAPLDPVSRAAMELLLGPVVQFVRDALDIPDDFSEWLADQLHHSVGLGNSLATWALNYFKWLQLYELPEAVPLSLVTPPPPGAPPAGSPPPATNNLDPVMLPISFVEVKVDAAELTVQADFGELT